MIRIYLVDDEKKALDNLEYLIHQVAEEELLVGSSHKPLEAVQRIHDFKPDILFLDVQMPHLDGFGILKALGKVSCSVVFTTAHEEYAIQAIKQSVFDYLLKPVDEDDLVRVLERYKAKVEAEDVESLQVDHRNQRIAIHQMDGVHFFNITDITRLESDGNYTKIYSTDGKFIISSKTLKVYEENMSGSGFVRIHNSHLVNQGHIRSILKNELVVMKDGSEVPLSRRRKKELRKVLGLE